jgi:hypothetical protein
MRQKPVDQVGVPAERLLEPDPIALAAQLALMPARLLAVEAKRPGLVAPIGEHRVRLGTEPGLEGVVGRLGEPLDAAQLGGGVHALERRADLVQVDLDQLVGPVAGLALPARRHGVDENSLTERRCMSLWTRRATGLSSMSSWPLTCRPRAVCFMSFA